MTSKLSLHYISFLAYNVCIDPGRLSERITAMSLKERIAEAEAKKREAVKAKMTLVELREAEAKRFKTAKVFTPKGS